MSYHITLLPGDGIGPEVIAAAETVLRALPLDFDLHPRGNRVGRLRAAWHAPA